MLASVTTFNALPAAKSAAHWHFDLRYLPLEPKPHHILLLARIDGASSHIEKLPMFLPSERDGLEFFPDTPADAAPTVAQALVTLFATKDALSKARPSRLMTPDPGLAVEVGKELKRIGVAASDLHDVTKSTPTAISIADMLFAPVWRRMLRNAGFHGLFATVLGTPEYIDMSKVKLREPEPSMTEGPEAASLSREQRKHLQALEYVKLWYEARPPTDRPGIDYASLDTMIMKANYVDDTYFPENPTHEIKEEADDGMAAAAFDYALRLMIKPKDQQNRRMIYKYLMMAIHPADDDSPQTLLTEIASNAHAILIRWCTEALEDEIRSRYLFAACHHAEQALILAKKVSLSDNYAAPVVLYFIRKELAPRLVPGSPIAMPALVMYKECRAAHKMRETKLKKEKRKMDMKRLKEPNRYRCANPDCGILADSGTMFKQCNGKCDSDKKPRYCSKECQRTDWKDHKAFCKPGMPCSVIDTTMGCGPAVVRGGDFSISITGSNGQVTYISSSTMSPEELRQFRDAATRFRVS
ncbi:hypothetical protein FB107DRAFT_293058 [Schizophyllum commune]